MADDGSQRRRHPRYRTDVPVTLFQGTRVTQARILNVSRGGCLVFPELGPGQTPEVKVSFPLDDGQPPINCKGEVVYSIRDRGTGIAFTEISIYNQDRITAHFERKAASGVAATV